MKFSKKILVDIAHTPHVNFFKNVINKLSKAGYEIHISYIDRGKLAAIVKDEFPEYKKFCVGRHRFNILSIIVESNIIKFFFLLRLQMINKYFVGLSVGSYLLGAVFRITGSPNLQYDDDPESKINAFLEKFTSTKLYYPIFNKVKNKRISSYKSLKEWSYLSPKYFKPNPSILSDYALEKNNYVFMREVNPGSVYYRNQKRAKILSISKKVNSEIKVVISLEDKKFENDYPPNWIILQEPVDQIHNLIYYSSLVISTGDSVVREGAILGVKSYYCGDRILQANQVLMDMDFIEKIDVEEAPMMIEKHIGMKDNISFKKEVRKRLHNEWFDTTQFIYDGVENIKNRV